MVEGRACVRRPRDVADGCVVEAGGERVRRWGGLGALRDLETEGLKV